MRETQAQGAAGSFSERTTSVTRDLFRVPHSHSGIRAWASDIPRGVRECSTFGGTCWWSCPDEHPDRDQFAPLLDQHLLADARDQALEIPEPPGTEGQIVSNFLNGTPRGSGRCHLNFDNAAMIVQWAGEENRCLEPIEHAAHGDALGGFLSVAEGSRLWPQLGQDQRSMSEA